MSRAPVQLTGGGLLAVVGVLGAVYLLYRASNTVGDIVDSVSETLSSVGDTVAHTVYPDSLLAPSETVSGKLDARYNTPGDDRSWISKAWDGYWTDVRDFWGIQGSSYLSDSDAIAARNTYAATDPRRVDSGPGYSGGW